MTAAVRPAEAGDAAAIRAVHLAAFPTDAEAKLVEAIAREGDAIVSLVAEQGGEIVGHVLLSRMAVAGDGRSYRSVGLAPLAVLPAAQRRGIGGALVEAALAQAAAAGEELVFVLGDPAYYGRFGFLAEWAAPFASPYAGPHLMALPLRQGLPLPQAGSAAYARAFADLAE